MGAPPAFLCDSPCRWESWLDILKIISKLLPAQLVSILMDLVPFFNKEHHRSRVSLWNIILNYLLSGIFERWHLWKIVWETLNLSISSNVKISIFFQWRCQFWSTLYLPLQFETSLSKFGKTGETNCLEIYLCEGPRHLPGNNPKEKRGSWVWSHHKAQCQRGIERTSEYNLSGQEEQSCVQYSLSWPLLCLGLRNEKR